MSEVTAIDNTVRQSDIGNLENPVVPETVDTGIPDRKPLLGVSVDTSTPESRMALRNEARDKVAFNNRHTTIIDDNTDLIF